MEVNSKQLGLQSKWSRPICWQFVSRDYYLVLAGWVEVPVIGVAGDWTAQLRQVPWSRGVERLVYECTQLESHGKQSQWSLSLTFTLRSRSNRGPVVTNELPQFKPVNCWSNRLGWLRRNTPESLPNWNSGTGISASTAVSGNSSSGTPSQLALQALVHHQASRPDTSLTWLGLWSQSQCLHWQVGIFQPVSCAEPHQFSLRWVQF